MKSQLPCPQVQSLNDLKLRSVGDRPLHDPLDLADLGDTGDISDRNWQGFCLLSR